MMLIGYACCADFYLSFDFGKYNLAPIWSTIMK